MNRIDDTKSIGITQPQSKNIETKSKFCLSRSGTSRQCSPKEGSSADVMDFTTQDKKTCQLMDANNELPFSVENYCSLLEKFDPKNDSSEKLESLLNDLDKVKNLPGAYPVEILSLILKIDSPLIAKYLKEHPGQMDGILCRDQVEILSNVAVNGHIDTFDYLMDVCKLDIYTKSGYYGTVLGAICSTKDERIKLLFNKVNINQQRNSRFTPLHYVARYNYIAAAKELLSRPEVDPNIEDKAGRTALYYAVANNNISIVETLLSHPKCIIKTKGEKNIFDYIKNHKIDPECLKLLQQHPSWPEIINQQDAPWLEDLRNGKFQSIKNDIENHGLPTKNIQKFISGILNTKLIENKFLVSALQGIINLQPSDPLKKKLHVFIGCKYYFDKYFDGESDRAHHNMRTNLKNIFYDCIMEHDFQSIHGLAALGLTTKNFRVTYSNADDKSNDKLEEDLVTGESPYKMDVLEAVFKSGFLSPVKFHELYCMAINLNQQKVAKLCHKYEGCIAFIDVDNKIPMLRGVSYNFAGFGKPDQQCANKAVKKMKSLQWDPEFIAEAEERGRLALESGETIWE